MCEQGRHRSYLEGLIHQVICEETGLNHRMHRFHCPKEDRDEFEMRKDCGCGVSRKGDLGCPYLASIAYSTGISHEQLRADHELNLQIVRQVIKCCLDGEPELMDSIGVVNKAELKKGFSSSLSLIHI